MYVGTAAGFTVCVCVCVDCVCVCVCVTLNRRSRCESLVEEVGPALENVHTYIANLIYK